VELPLLQYLKDHPGSWRAHYLQGYVLFRSRKVGDSIRELARSLELNVNNPEAHKMLGKDLVLIGKFDYAQTELQQAVRLKPDSAEVHYTSGRSIPLEICFQRQRLSYRSNSARWELC